MQIRQVTDGTITEHDRQMLSLITLNQSDFKMQKPNFTLFISEQWQLQQDDIVV